MHDKRFDPNGGYLSTIWQRWQSDEESFWVLNVYESKKISKLMPWNQGNSKTVHTMIAIYRQTQVLLLVISVFNDRFVRKVAPETLDVAWESQGQYTGQITWKSVVLRRFLNRRGYPSSDFREHVTSVSSLPRYLHTTLRTHLNEALETRSQRGVLIFVNYK